MPRKKNSLQDSGEISSDTKTIITVIVLCTAYPVGLILMWMWTDWKRWVKWVISIPIIFVVLGIVGFAYAFSRAAALPMKHSQCLQECNTSVRPDRCIQRCEQLLLKRIDDQAY